MRPSSPPKPGRDRTASAARALLWRAAAALPVLAAAAAFYGPALRLTPGLWPAPLDDVYIHFGFARSAALGHPFAWIPGHGYSSGATSITYPLVLAPAYLLGLRGSSLGVFAALLACAALLDLCRSARLLVDPGAGPAPRLDLGPRPRLPASARWVAWIAPLFVVAVPLVDWSWFSGMEVALLGAILGRALVAVRRAEHAPPHGRGRAQLRAGLWCALMVATRPESVALALPLAVAVAHAAGSLSALAALARAAGPTGLFLAAQATLNRALTGEWSAAGAVRKLIHANPYLTPIEVGGEVIRNLLALRVQALESALGGPRWAWILPLLALAAALDRRSRRLAIPLLLGAWGSLFLVSLNATARFQNLRYAVPALVMMLLAALLGVGAIARRGRAGALVAAALALPALLAPSTWFGRQIDHFARASRNIAEQQVEVARRLAAREPRPRRVLLNDAGAIPYLSGLPALDGLGLGGFRGLPFARASVHGVPAVVELIERLDAGDRPDIMALYPNWWGGLADVFGHRIDAVTIDDNVICGSPEKVIYSVDWSPLSPAGDRRPGALMEVDVADLVSERAQNYKYPAPRAGWVIGAVLEDGGGARRFDGGRIIPEGREESFEVSADVPRGPAALVIRTDGGAPLAIEVAVDRRGGGGERHPVEVPARPDGRWSEIEVALEAVEKGDRIRIHATRGALRSFHCWLMPR